MVPNPYFDKIVPIDQLDKHAMMWKNWFTYLDKVAKKAFKNLSRRKHRFVK